MPFNFSAYLKGFYFSLFRSKGTPARLSAKRVFLLLFLFFAYPFWNAYIRIGYALDNLFYREFQGVHSPDPVFIIGNYRSGSTFFHRLILRDPQFTCLKAWEIYFAPALIHRKALRLILKISEQIGSPVQKWVKAFDQLMNDIYSMHKTGLYTYEQDSQLFYHTWSSYNVFAIFPFPELARRYIYYDQAVPERERLAQFNYYRNVIKRHLFLHSGQLYLSKNPDFSPLVKTILEIFPNAKFINLVRPPEQMLPSSINLWASNWRAYGSPDETYPLIDVIKEHALHWYDYPHKQLVDLPPDRYTVVYFKDLVDNPREEVSRVYRQFGFNLSKDFHQILVEETIKARNYNGNNHYSLAEMGLQFECLEQEFAPVLAHYANNLSLKNHRFEKNKD